MATQTYVNSVTLTEATEFNRFDTAAYPALSGVAGTNTITATGPANLTLVATNPAVWFIPAVTNTGATTINITPSGGAALGAKNVFSGGTACVGGELVAGVPVAIVYDGTQFNILGSPAVTRGTKATTFTFNGSGGSTGSLTLTMQKQGQWVTLNVPAATATTGTGSTALVQDTAIDAAFRPAAAQVGSINSILNNAAGTSDAGQWSMATNGKLTIVRENGNTAWTNSASGGVNNNFTITYFVG